MTGFRVTISVPAHVDIDVEAHSPMEAYELAKVIAFEENRWIIPDLIDISALTSTIVLIDGKRLSQNNREDEI